MSSSWEGDWLARLQRKVKARGFPDITAFALARPRKTFEELADELDRRDVAPIHIQWVLYEEACKRNDVLGFAKDCLVRELWWRIPRGWKLGDNFWSEVAGAYAWWKGALDTSYAEHAERAWDWLEVQDIPEGWLPQGPDDPWIEAMFRETGFPGAGEAARADE